MLAHGTREFRRYQLAQAGEAELGLLIDGLVGIGREQLETVDEIGWIGAGASQGEVFAGAAIQRGDAFALDRLPRLAPGA